MTPTIAMIKKKDKQLEQYFQLELENLNYSTLLHMEPREKLPMTSYEIQERANKTSVYIYQVLIPYQRLPTSYMQ